MSTQVYTLRDSVLGSYTLPFYATSNLHARRICKEVIISGDNSVAHSPIDFELFRLGEFDSNTGLITSLDRPEPVCRLDQLHEEAI